MSLDVLASALEALRLRGTVYFQSDFRAPWGMAVPANNVAAFHVIA
ncbi:MAG: AraC family transcriptional regulator, partial [Gemmatimonadetes bacterium]|nr:AraC family transcriptional regulator [Gemmatimonadota bacterium]